MSTDHFPDVTKKVPAVGARLDGRVVPQRAELPANRLPNLRRRVNRARRFPNNTCPASRHLHMIAEGMLRKRGYPMLHDEPEHCAGSMLAVLESLWKLRTDAAELAGALRELHDVCTRMDLDRFAERPSELEYIGAMVRAAGALRHNVRANPDRGGR